MNGRGKMVETEILAVRNVIRDRVSDVPEDKLLALRNYIDYLTGEEWDIDKEYDIPLDEYYYEMSKLADERRGEEYMSLEEALKKSGLTYAAVDYRGNLYRK
jgi:hypothetical protein